MRKPDLATFGREGPAVRPARWLRRLFLALLFLALLFGLDLRRAPAQQWSAQFLLWGITKYQAMLSPHLPRLGVQCRFTPTCSHYAAAVIRRDGALVGTFAALGRILRCGPWTAAGTVDPP